MSTANENTFPPSSGLSIQSVTGPTATLAAAGSVPTVGYTQFRIGAVADTASATLKGRWVGFDSQGNVVAVSPQITFTADSAGLGNPITASYPAGIQYLATPNADTRFDCSGLYSACFQIDSMTGTTWYLNGRKYAAGLQL